LQVPKALIKSLPFASKPKDAKKRTKPTYIAKRAVVMEPEERKLHTLMQRVSTIRNDKAEKRKEMQALRKKVLEKKIAKNDEGKVQVCACDMMMSCFVCRCMCLCA
jgi:ribosome biogenesis protein BMS1